ncbi:MAG: Crp/Fnr family transcriptional regulator [Hyphomicrobiaceae bacterium]
MTIERVQQFLKNATFLGCLSDAALTELVRTGSTRVYVKDEAICARGDAGQSAMVILSGRLKVSNINADGREITLNYLGVGDLVGEIALLDGRERTANVTALETSELFILQRRDLLPALRANPEAMLEMMGVLCDKLRRTTAMLEDSLQEMPARVARGLLRLAEQHGVRQNSQISIELRLSQAELGTYVGLSRPNVSRQLKEFRDAHIITTSGRTIVILNEAQLRQIAVGVIVPVG